MFLVRGELHMGIERAVRNVAISEGEPDEAASASDELQGEVRASGMYLSGARLRAAASEPEENDLDSLPELPFTD
jgi:hypothetical protein